MAESPSRRSWIDKAIWFGLWPAFAVLIAYDWVRFRCNALKWWCVFAWLGWRRTVRPIVWESRKSMRRWRRRQWYRLRHSLVWWRVNRAAMIYADNELSWYETDAVLPPEPSVAATAPDSKNLLPLAPPPETRPAGVTLH